MFTSTATFATSDGLRVQAAVAASTASTAFTYQDYLSNGGDPADGSYDFEFKVYSAESAGVAVVNRTASGFEVVELNDGRSNAEFSVLLSYRRQTAGHGNAALRARAVGRR